MSDALSERRERAELSLLGLLATPLVANPVERIEGLVDELDFSSELLGRAFVAVVNLHVRGRFTVGAYREQLIAAGLNDQDAGRLLDILAAPSFMVDIEALAADVRRMANKARLRGVVDLADQMVADATMADDQLQVGLETALVAAVRTGVSERKAAHFAEGVDGWLDTVRDNIGVSTGISTGVADLDEMIGGYRPGELIVIGGRPSMGKSIVATAAATAAAATGAGVFISSLEMPREQLRARVLCDLCRETHRIEYQSLLKRRLSHTDEVELRRAASVLKDYPIIVDDRGGLTSAQIALAARRARRRFESEGKKLGLIVIDYLQLMAQPPEWRGDKNNGVAANSAAMKRLAKEMDCPVMLLSQLSRRVEERDDKRPMMSDLRDSGAIEQDADAIIFPFRAEWYLAADIKAAKTEKARIDAMAELAEFKNRIDLLVEKQRNGPRGVVKADCDAGTSSIRDYGKLRPGAAPSLFGDAT